MSVTKHALGDTNTCGGGLKPPSSGLAPDALPEVQKPVLEENSQTGVSTKNALSGKSILPSKEQTKNIPHWYALRTTYGREKKAADYLNEKGVLVYCPTLSKVKIYKGKCKKVEESLIPNILFAYGTEEKIKSFVYDNVNLPFLRFYYNHIHLGSKTEKEPLIVPNKQIENLRIICEADVEDIIVSPSDIQKFSKGQLVKIIEGNFKGVSGRVARFQGQQRVAVIIDGLLTIATAYIPSAFLQVLTKEQQ